MTDPRGIVTSYAYNALGDLTQQVSPDAGTTYNTYDSGGFHPSQIAHISQ